MVDVVAEKVAGETATRVRILVVDDSAVTRAYIVGVLEQLPAVELISVESGAQALRAIKSGGISLVLCDYEMPDMSGLQVLRFARQAHSALELPMLMLTSRDEPDIKVKAYLAGANDYIAKQAQPEELLARVRTQITLLRAQRSMNDARLHKAEQQKFEALGHLAEGLAHELNTPAQYVRDNLAFLAESFEAIGTFVAELRQLPDSTERSLVETALQRIEYEYLATEVPRCIAESTEGIDNVARVVAVMRDFAKPGMTDKTAHSLNEIIRGALAVTRGQWHQAAEIELDLLETLPRVHCIGVTIKQVVLYALMNAVKALSPRGAERIKGRILIRTRIEPEWALIEVLTSGKGIGSTAVERVLDPVLGSLASDDQALAHARGVVVHQHQGRFEIETSPAGNLLAIRLPLEGS